MSLSQSDQYLSIQPGQVDGVDLPKFTVITGENGAGKTHLLEAIAGGTIALDEPAIENRNDIRLVKAGSLTVRDEDPIQPGTYRDTWTPIWGNTRPNSAVSWTEGVVTDGLVGSYDHVAERLVHDGTMSVETINRMKDATGGKQIGEMTPVEFCLHGPLMLGKKHMLEHKLSEVFMTWAMRRKANQYLRIEATENGEDTPWLTDEAFTDRFGEPPWEVVNVLLRGVSLPFRYVKPDTLSERNPYSAVLRHDDGCDVSPGSLSAGERTLVAIAQSVYSTSALLENTRLPKVMLFDEPDATLHPSMVQRMLNVFVETFVEALDIRVVITTHSPSTVALAPDESLMVMAKAMPRLEAVSKEAAIRALTVGIPTLSVRVENQRQVFVEAAIDQEIFQLLFKILQRRLHPELTPVFIASSTGGAEGGKDRVRALVNELRRGNVLTVFGIVDRDDGIGPGNEGIKFAHDRYAIENLIADPLLVGCFLLREHMVTAQDLNLPEGTRAKDLEDCHAQPIIDAVTQKVGLSGGGTRTVTYAGGLTATIPGDYLDKRGHDLMESLIDAYDRLGPYRSSQKTSDDLLKDIVRKAADDHHEFIPGSVVELLRSVLQS